MTRTRRCRLCIVRRGYWNRCCATCWRDGIHAGDSRNRVGSAFAACCLPFCLRLLLRCFLAARYRGEVLLRRERFGVARPHAVALGCLPTCGPVGIGVDHQLHPTPLANSVGAGRLCRTAACCDRVGLAAHIRGPVVSRNLVVRPGRGDAVPGLARPPPPKAITALLVALLAANAISPKSAGAPAGWEAVDTRFGSRSGQARRSSEFSTATWIQRRALESPGEVVVFPETVVSMWTDATELYWQAALDELRATGKTIVSGPPYPARTAVRPRTQFDQVCRSSEKAGYLVSLSGGRPVRPSLFERASCPWRGDGRYLQRIPVPLGMWKPFDGTGVPLSVFGPAVMEVRGQRVAPLLCYETLLLFPLLQSCRKRPQTILAVANDHWALGETIPRFQRTAVAVWARLFSLHQVIATNR